MGAIAKKTKKKFKINEYVVYPSHGVGQVTNIEKQEIAGIPLELYVISFEQDKMILRVPLNKADSSGLRALADKTVCEKALTMLKGRARVKRTMWSRRAQEYEAKINSGDLLAVCEVVRDLHRLDSQPEQSYSERQLYELALDRFAREIAIIRSQTLTEAIGDLEKIMSDSPKRKKAVAAAANAAAPAASAVKVKETVVETEDKAQVKAA
jgi:CarD family transcriptional regulator